MAKFDPLVGIKGKLGDVSFYVDKHGRQIVRTITKARDPKTPKQLAHRAKFALVNKSLSPLSTAIRIANNGDSTVYRSLIGKAYKEAVVGEYPNFTLDYSKIKIANGQLRLPKDITAHANDESSIITISWEPGNSNDILNIVCFNEADANNYAFLERTKCSAGKAKIELPNSWDSAVIHCWVYTSSRDYKKKSDSFYIDL